VEGPSHYLRSKGAAEQRIRDSNPDLLWTIFRPSVIFGEHDSLTRRFADLLRYIPMLPLARADALFAPVYIGDVVEAMVRTLALAESCHRAYDLGGPERMTLAELVRAVARITQRRRLVFGIPDWAGRLQADLFERLPGKLLSRDNFNSLSVASVPTHDGLAELGICPASLLQIAPTYLRPR
jgi:NADH dehydrogenase